MRSHVNEYCVIRSLTSDLIYDLPTLFRILLASSNLWLSKKSKKIRLVTLKPITCGALGDLAAFVQFKWREKHPWKSITSSRIKLATLLKVILVHELFSRTSKWYQIVQSISYDQICFHL